MPSWTRDRNGPSCLLIGARQVLKNSGVGDAFNNIGKQLKDGHWVLAFPNVEAANYATLLVDQHAAKLRAYYCEVLFSLILEIGRNFQPPSRNQR